MNADNKSYRSREYKRIRYLNLEKRYLDSDRTRILDESRNTVSWIYEIIKNTQ